MVHAEVLLALLDAGSSPLPHRLGAAAQLQIIRGIGIQP